MKKLLLLIALIPVTLFAQQRIKSVSSNDKKSTITILGTEKPIKIVHITDSHVTLVGEEDMPYQQYWQRMGAAYENTRHFNGGEMSRTEAFKDVLSEAVDEKADLLVLSGDILNYPSPEAVRFIEKELKMVDIPYIYVAGNHDWHMEGMEGAMDSLRQEWREKVLTPLYQGHNPSHYAIVKDGVNFVVIDNSTYQISTDQLKFFIEQKSKKMPIVLIMHIPINISGNSGGIGDPKWGYDSDSGYYTERRQRWSKNGNSKETIEFVKQVKQTTDLIALTGHIHRNKFDNEEHMIQLVAKYSRDGSFRLVELIPSK